MTPPKLTDEQKEQLKMAHRSSMRIDETWQLYTMLLSQDKHPHEALERAQEAVAVWSEWMDNNEVQPPEIERPSFAEQMGEQMRTIMGKIAPVPFPFADPGERRLDAEFLENPASVPPRTPERSEPDDK